MKDEIKIHNVTSVKCGSVSIDQELYLLDGAGVRTESFACPVEASEAIVGVSLVAPKTHAGETVEVYLIVTPKAQMGYFPKSIKVTAEQRKNFEFLGCLVATNKEERLNAIFRCVLYPETTIAVVIFNGLEKTISGPCSINVDFCEHEIITNDWCEYFKGRDY